MTPRKGDRALYYDTHEVDVLSDPFEGWVRVRNRSDAFEYDAPIAALEVVKRTYTLEVTLSAEDFDHTEDEMLLHRIIEAIADAGQGLVR